MEQKNNETPADAAGENGLAKKAMPPWLFALLIFGIPITLMVVLAFWL